MNGQMMMPNQMNGQMMGAMNGQPMNGGMMVMQNSMGGQINGPIMMNGQIMMMMPNQPMANGPMMNGSMNGEMNGSMMNGQMNGTMMNGGMVNTPVLDQNGHPAPGPVQMEQSTGAMVDGSAVGQPGAPMMMNGQGMMMSGQGPMMNGGGQMIQSSNIMTGQNGQMMLTGPNGTVMVNPIGENLYNATMQDGRQMNGQMVCMPDANCGQMVVGMMVPMEQVQGQIHTDLEQLSDPAPSGSDDAFGGVLLRDEDDDGPEDTEPPMRALPVKMPQTPEMTPETPPALDGLELPAARDAWRVRIQNASGTESVVGPVWVACAMISELEFVHPETQEELTVEDVQSLEQALREEPQLRKGFSVLRAFELCQEEPDSAELQSMRDAANEELEALRKQAAEETQREAPEQTGDIVQLLSEAQRAMLPNGLRAAEDGWVTTKSRARKGAVVATGSLFPYSRKLVQTLLGDPHVLVWVQRIEQQLLRLVTPAGGVRPSASNPPQVQFQPLAAKRRAMLHEICGHFGLHTTVDIPDPAEPPQALRPMLVAWTEQATCPPTLPSKAVEVFASAADKAFVNETRNDPTSYESAVYHVYLPDTTYDDVSAKVEAEVPADASPQVTDLGGRHQLVQFSSKLAAQQFLLARRQESTSGPESEGEAQWWSGDVAFAQLQAQHRAKQERKGAGKERQVAASPPAVSIQAQQQLLEMGFSEEKIAAALASASGNVEAAAQALLTAAEQPPAEEEPPSAPSPPSRTGKKDNDDWVRASRGVRDAPKKPKAKAKK